MRAYLELFTVGVDGHLQDPSETWLERYGLGRGGAVLVRPDGHVAWRSPMGVADPSATLDAVLRRVLSADAAGTDSPPYGGASSPASTHLR